MFYKIIEEDTETKETFINSVGTIDTIVSPCIEITETEYNQILDIVRNKPNDTEDKVYKLTTDLVYEAYDRPEEPEPEEVISEYDQGYQQALLDLAEIESETSDVEESEVEA